jgi:hypothetical protein
MAQNTPDVSMKQIGYPGPGTFYKTTLGEAAMPELEWPDVWHKVYKKMYRTDPEISLMRLVYSVWASHAEIDVERNEYGTDDDKKAVDFFVSALYDIERGIKAWQSKTMTAVPLMGWGVHEIIPCVRKHDWIPPGKDDWRSEYNDGMIGVRRLGWRDYSTFSGWEGKNGNPAFVQVDEASGATVEIPIDRCLHTRFGDVDSPYGISPLEALYRLERYKSGFEVIFGIGMEKAAGHLSVHLERAPTVEDVAAITRAAKSILSAQAGNFGLWPPGVKSEVIDAQFTASQTLLEAIRFYHLLKLQVLYSSQWFAISTTSNTGTYSAATDSSQMALSVFNAGFESVVEQFDQKVGRLLWKWNRHHFPKAAKRPRFVAMPVKKEVSPMEMAQLIAMLSPIMPLGDQDFIEIRRNTGIFANELPENPTHIPDRGQLRSDARKVEQKLEKTGTAKTVTPETDGIKGGADAEKQ